MSAHAESAHLLISQIQLAGETSTDEFVELYNPTNSAINVADWKLVKKTSSGSQSNLVSAFPTGTNIGPHKYFLITHKTGYKGAVSADTTYSGSSYSVAADNTVILSDGSGVVIDKVGFGEAKDFEIASATNPDAGQSLKRQGWENGAMQDTDNNQNDFTSGASSPRNSSYGGVYVPPAQSQSSSSTPPNYPAPPSSSNFEKGQLLINEVYPVADAGEKEWIELYNPSASPLSLDGWTIEDAKDLIASLYGTISKYSVWEITPARLNNDGDTVKLKSPNGQIIDVVSYGKMSSSSPTLKAGESLARKVDGFYTGSEADFVITQTPTAGEKNLVTTAAEEENTFMEDEEPAASSTPVTGTAIKKSLNVKKVSGATALRGIVTVPPGLFAAQYFYIQKEDGGGVQIYSFKSADIPKLAIGDYIYVYGAESSYLGESRVKTKLGGIKLLSRGAPIEPIEVSIDELDEAMSGALVKISGEVTEKKSAGMYLDDGNGEIYINLKKKAAINTREILPKDKVEIIGVLISNNRGFSLLPRRSEDIKKLEIKEIADIQSGASIVSILKYALPSVAAVGLGLAAYFWRMRQKMIFEGSEIVEQNNTNAPQLLGRE